MKGKNKPPALAAGQKRGAAGAVRGGPPNDLSTPTGRMVSALQAAYNHFNARLFNDELPHLLLNLSRSKPGVMGFFAPDSWRGAAGDVCELSLTPECTNRSAENVFATLVHEMAHFLDHVRGVKPKSPGYHARCWFETMEKIGLPAERIGNSYIKVDHRIAPNGPFLKAFRELPPEVRLPFKSREVFGGGAKGGEDDGEESGEEKGKETKMGKRARYECSGKCKTTMRGPSGRTLICGDCKAPYVETGF